MGIKISDLPSNSFPFSGTEILPLVQSNETRRCELSSLLSYLSSALVSDTELSNLSGAWQDTYTNVQSNSSNWSLGYVGYTSLTGLSSNWQDTYTNVQSNSGNWNSVYSSVCALSTAWEESAEILPTVTNYLSTNNVLLSSLTVTRSVAIGTDTPNQQLTVVGNTSATGVAYTRELDFGSSERPSLTGIKQALNSFLYVPPALLYVRVNGNAPLTFEVGQALTSPAITWTSNKVEAAAISSYRLTLPTGAITTGTNTFTFSTFNDPNTYSITTLPNNDTQALSSWFVRVTDWADVQSTSSATATWRYRVYYGATSQATPTDAQIRAGTDDSTLATSRLGLGSRSVIANNEYMYVAYPARFGTTSQFRVNGLPNTAFTPITINNFTNAYGGTAQYYVYRSDNLLTGTYTIEII
jgi:hypothetical protein